MRIFACAILVTEEVEMKHGIKDKIYFASSASRSINEEDARGNAMRSAMETYPNAKSYDVSVTEIPEAWYRGEVQS